MQENKTFNILIGPRHLFWLVFLDRLSGPEGCDGHYTNEADPSTFTYTCTDNFERASAILTSLGFRKADIKTFLDTMRDLGLHCDCKFLLSMAHNHNRLAREYLQLLREMQLKAGRALGQIETEKASIQHRMQAGKKAARKGAVRYAPATQVAGKGSDHGTKG